MDALGFIETKGKIGIIEATDAMLKSADVKVEKTIAIGGALITCIVKGDVGSVKAAVTTAALTPPFIMALITPEVNPSEATEPSTSPVLK